MGHTRNTEGLKRNAESKRDDTYVRAEQAVREMVKERGPRSTPINFSTVAHRAGVSRTWLYAQEDLRERIEHLRVQGDVRRDLPPKEQRASEASKDAIIATLRSRIEQLDAENKELRKKVETLGGIAYSKIVSNIS
ncbi:MAG TPA: DUF6262 family protein [Chloroflexia bacterium]|jgi:glucan phosphoethanolaminetransferase (alkaline phosphatase superfamily)